MLSLLLFWLMGAVPYRPLSSSSYLPLEDYSWEFCTQSSMVFEEQDLNLDYQYCAYNSGISSGYISGQLRYSTLIFFKFLKEYNIQYLECEENSALEIFYIPMDVLNDHSRFSKWQNKVPPGSIIWGLYDSRELEYGVSAIMLTNQSFNTKKIFAHELSHYWYDRLCLDSSMYETENLARKFEQYYLQYSR